MHYSPNANHCRVDIWKQSGKWYDTVMVDFISVSAIEGDLTSEFERIFKEQYPGRYIGMRATCLEPGVARPYPISIVIEGE